MYIKITTAENNSGDFMFNIKENLLIFTLGGALYGLIELIWRKYTHWTMVLTGGFCFLVLYRIFTVRKKLSIVKKCLIGSAVITAVELVAGFIVNIRLKLNVWDYSNMKINLCGQICPLYSALWALLTVPISLCCDAIEKIKQQ